MIVIQMRGILVVLLMTAIILNSSVVNAFCSSPFFVAISPRSTSPTCRNNNDNLCFVRSTRERRRIRRIMLVLQIRRQLQQSPLLLHDASVHNNNDSNVRISTNNNENSISTPLRDNHNTTNSNDEEKSISENSQKKKKKNKYEMFSKVMIENEKDPLERLIEESVQKNIDISTAAAAANIKQQQPNTLLLQKPEKIEFPDTKTINPYNPNTFGYIEIGTIIGPHGVHGWVKLKCNDIESTIEQQQQRIVTSGMRHIKSPNKRAPRPIILLQGKYRLNNEFLIQLDGVINRDMAQTYKGTVLYIREEQQEQLLLDIAATAAADSSNSEADENAKDEPEEYSVSDLVGVDVFLVRSSNAVLQCSDTTTSEHEINSIHGRTIDTDVENDDDDESLYYVGKVNGIVFGDDLCTIPGLVTHDYLEICIPRGIGGTFSSFHDELVLIPFVPQLVPIVDIASNNPNGEKRIYIDPPNGLLDLTYVREEKTRIKAFLPAASVETQKQ